MIAIALKWLKDNWETVAVAVLILGLAFYVGSLQIALGNARGEVARLTGTIAEQRGQIAEWKFAYDVLAAKTMEQSAAIAALHAESEKKRQAGIVALASAEKRATGLQQQADWLSAQLNKQDAHGKGCNNAFAEWRAQP